MKHITLFFFFISSVVFSQNLKIEYNFHLNKSNDLTSTIKKYTLEQTETVSIFQFNEIRDKTQFKNQEFASVISDKDSIVTYMVGDDIIEFSYKEKYFKDFKINSQSYNYRIGANPKPCYIQEKINLFDWEILTDRDTVIASYSCRKATTKFRGRNYVAYFTNEIANQGGPWKFDGLPGIILKIYSTDGYLLIEPTKIILNHKIKSRIDNPFDGKKTISFEQIKEQILEGDKKYLAYLKSRPNAPSRIVISAPEAIENIGIGERVYE